MNDPTIPGESKVGSSLDADCLMKHVSIKTVCASTFFLVPIKRPSVETKHLR